MSFLSGLVNKASRAYDQVNPLDNGRTWSQRTPVNNNGAVYQATHNAATNYLGDNAQAAANGAFQHVVKPVTNYLVGGGIIGQHYQPYQDFSRAASLGLGRSLVGTGQAISGLYDIAGGNHGQNRFDRTLDKYGKQLDVAANKPGLNKYVYHGAQTVGDLAQFATGGGELKFGAKVVTSLLKLEKAVATGAKVAKTLEKPSQAFKEVGKSGNIAQRTGGKFLGNVLDPRYQAANAAFAAMNQGKRASHGEDVNAKTFGTDLVAGGVAFPAAGAAFTEVARPTARAIAPALRNGAERAAFAFNEKTGKKFNGLTEQQLVRNPDHLQALDNYQDALRTNTIDQIPAADMNRIQQALHDIKNENGLDFISGSRDAQAARIEAYQEQWHEGIKRYQDNLAKKAAKKSLITLSNEGGYVRNPFAQGDDANIQQGLSNISRQMQQDDPALNSSLGNAADRLVGRLDNEAVNPNAQKLGDIAQAKYGKATPGTSYRSTHQIDGNTSYSLDKADLAGLKEQVKQLDGYITNSAGSDLRKLEKIVKNPEADVKIYRASPVNELNDADWVTTSREYANDIKRQNGGKVYEYTVKGKDLHLPNNIGDNPSLARFAAFQYRKGALAPAADKSIKTGADDLIKEAKKYKSADEFVKAHANLLHGTKADFSEFDPSLLGTNTGAPSAKKGFFFTDTPEIANTYANPGRNFGTAISKNLEGAFKNIEAKAKAEGLTNSLESNQGASLIVGSWPKVKPGTSREAIMKTILDRMDSLKERFNSPESIAKVDRFKQLATEELNNTPITELEMFGKVMKSKVDFRNPLVFDDQGFRNGASYAQRIDEAVANGHDGVIIKNTQDPLKGNIYVAFDKNQIKTEKQLEDIYNQAHVNKREVAELTRKINAFGDENTPAKQSLLDRLKKLTDLNEGGYIKNPFGGDELNAKNLDKLDRLMRENDTLNRQISRAHHLAKDGAQPNSSSMNFAKFMDQRLGLKKLNDQGNTGSTGSPFGEMAAAGVNKLKGGKTDLSAYIDQQTKLQDTARKAATPNKLAAAYGEFKRKMVDDLSPIEDTLNRAIHDGANVAPEQNIKYQLDRAIRGDTIGAQYIKDNGLAKIIQDVPDAKAFDQYLIARHAADLEKQGIKTGRNLQADRDLVQGLAPEYEQYAQAVNGYSQKLLDSAVDYGLISKDLATHLKQKYPNYVPVNRIFDENELASFKGTGSGKASISSQSVVQKIKGSERQIESPLSSLVDKSVNLVKQGERNRAAQMLTSYKDLPGNPFGLRELAKNETVGSKPVVTTLINGEAHRFETTPEIAAAAKSLNKEQIGLIGQIFAVPTRILRLGATGVNVGFAGANIVKDVASSFINSKHPFQASVANPEVFVSALKAALNHGSAEYGELVRQGAGGTSFDIARNAPRQNVREIRMQKNAATKALYTVTTPTGLLRAVENTIGRSEEFNRAIQYFGNKNAELNAGRSLQQAQILGADAARNNTVNFARAGEYGRVLNSVLPYLNAGIQGSRTLLRNVKDRPLQTAAKLTVVGFLPTAAVTAWNLSDPDRKAAYDDIKDYEKQSNLIIVPPNPKKDPKTGKWNVIKIPVSQEVANLNDIVRNGVETGLGDGSIKMGDLIGNVIGTTTSLNAQSPRQFIGQITPQAIKPGIESLVNQNLYTGNKIVPDSQKNLDPRDQYGDYTSGTAKELGKVTGLSPRHIDNFIRTSTGGTGQNFVNLSDRALAKTGVISPEEVRGRSLSDSVSGRFSGAQGQSEYDIADKKTAEATKKLKQLPEYQAMSPEEKVKALNRLKNDTNKAYLPAKDGKDTKLSTRQQSLKDGNPDLNSYLTAQKSGGSSIKVNTGINPHAQKVLNEYNNLDQATRDAKTQNEGDYQFKVAEAKYLNDKANGSLTSVEDFKRQQELGRLQIGSSYSKQARELYGLSKTDLQSYLNAHPQNADKLYNEVLAYDKALYDAGASKTLKFKYGLSNGTTARSSSGGRKSTKSTKTASGLGNKSHSLLGAINSTKNLNAKVRTAKVGKTRSLKYATKTNKYTFKRKVTA